MPVELQFTPLLIPYVISVAVTLGLAVYAARRYYTNDAATNTTLAFFGIVLSVSVWTIARGLELLFVSQTLSRFWLSILYVGLGGAAMSVLFFALAFTGRKHLLTRRNMALLLVVPVLGVGIAATNQLHELFWVSHGFPRESGWWGGIVVHDREFQPLLYLYLLYVLTAVVIALYYLLRSAARSATVYRRQTLALVVGSVVPVITAFLFVFGWQPLVPDFLDLSPVGFTVLGLCYGYAIFRHRLLDLVPIARDTVIEGMRDGYIVLDTENRVIDLNTRARELFDVDESVIGAPLVRAFPACAETLEEHEHGSHTETDIELELNGDRRFLTMSVSSLYEDEQVVGRLLLLQDVTERWRIQRRYQALIENSSDIIFVIDRNHEITYASPSLETITGVAPDAVVGLNAPELMHPGDRAEFERLVEQLLDNPGEQFRYEYRVPDSEGDWLYMEASVWNLLDDPFVDGIVLNAREITERKQRERELERANERLEEFASVISHDLRNPLNVAYGHLELARESDDEYHLDKTEESLDRMNAIVEDVLELARKGQQIGETDPVDLETNARTAWGYVETNGASLVVADDVTIEADSDRLLQLFENLFRNAVEHGSTSNRTGSDDAVEHGSTSNRRGSDDAVEHGSTSNRTGSDEAVEHGSETPVFTRSSGGMSDQSDGSDGDRRSESDGRDGSEGDGADRGTGDGHASDLTVTVGFDDVLYVEDDGTGIPEDDREDVLRAGYTTSNDGTGFGLSIVAQIADAHGWNIEITESEEGGARFEFSGVKTVE